MSKNLILLFTRNPELGKVKTRLAASIGNENALEIYITLLEHTKKVALETSYDKRVLYSEEVNFTDMWDSSKFQKKLQIGSDLGERMHNAFQEGFKDGYEKIVIVGSDLIALESTDITAAMKHLEDNDIVLGPAEDGGYYLLGMKKIPQNIFSNKDWGTDSVLEDTLIDIASLKYHLLQEKNDIDTYDDIKNIPLFHKYKTK